MVKGFGLTTLAALVAIVGFVGLWTSPVSAQEDPGAKIISFEAKSADIRESLRNLFKQVGVSYSIAPEVQGTINLQLTNVTFDVALQNIVRQVDAAYHIEGGVYQIVKRGQVRPRVVSPDPTDNRIVIPATTSTQARQTDPPVISQDGKYLYILRGGTLFKVNKSDLKTVAARKLGE
jgi:type II secretory pathway component HofQ